MVINIFQFSQLMNSIKFSIQILFVMFRRGQPGTPIGPAPVLLSGIFPDISSERLRVYRDRSPALVLWRSRLGYVYRDGFSNVLIGGGCAFRGPYQSLT